MNLRLLGPSLALWHLDKHRSVPWWTGLMVSAGVGGVVGVLIVFVAALLSGQILDASFWRPGLLPSALLGVAIALLTHGAFRLLERRLPAVQLQQLNEGTARGSLLVFIGIPTVCSVLGLVIVDTLLMSFRLGLPVPPRVPSKGTLITFLFCGAGFAGLSLWRLRSQLRAQKTRSQLTQAQLRLLQAQIEPHFLFNTLANVQGLIDYEPAQAKHMLDAFTDYLRASLRQMRAEDVSLSQELALVQNYLAVMHCRMGERLKSRVDVAPELLDARLPPLLLQPLVENALHHGLEPQLQGGLLQIRARPQDDGLVVEIEDDGIGLAGSRQRPRQGHGMALQNIRERLLAFYGPGASLVLTDGAGGRGTCVRLVLQRRRPLGRTDGG
ncbi:histidine kinase [Pelomonas sp. APW6]|uniref:Histidine kinase n=1 Tax=Roseateles subflavus TaxID=3053353 RepID=A0ABT7LNT6_9BURK|nr:histidine kinase [Pelomonas sp. APW6]MDL5034536.1 histidine kinase [Pelomonas sp. APW6]